MAFEIDFKTKDLSSTYIYYEIYDSSLKKLDLNVCNDIKINIYHPVILDDSLSNLIEKTSKLGYNIFDESDSFYNDICIKFTTENGTDILLSDRKKDIFIQTLNKNKFAKLDVNLNHIIQNLKRLNVIVIYPKILFTK
jgi:hypothetical protein